MGMKCPYCDSEINEKRLEAEDGCCPECGAFLTMIDVFEDDSEENEYDDEDGYDDDDDDDAGSYGGSGRDDYEMDEFDKFWEEEERLEKNRRREGGMQ